MAETFRLSTRRRSELVEITRQVQEIVSRTGLTDGVIVVYVPHTTAGVCINENADPDVRSDVTRFLERLIPQDAGFDHVEENSDSHIKAILTGSSVTALVEEGRLLLGRWQGIYFAEYDGPRTREVWTKNIGSRR
ncbi:MAG: secondary thiamine-phosphate synthase enzyme YjbQ [Armatimonadetes bacterium]|nr:secondary thiamine-phosphate synthase enzyme YjbQ [Armatimonadota bacterium]